MNAIHFLFELSASIRSKTISSSKDLDISNSITEYIIKNSNDLTKLELSSLINLRNKIISSHHHTMAFREAEYESGNWFPEPYREQLATANDNSFLEKEISNAISRCVLKNKEDNYSIPDNIFSEDITEIINLTLQESITCINNNCNLSCIILCGKIIETAINDIYIKEYPDCQEKLGIDAMINRLKKKHYILKSSIKDQLNLIKKHRNKSVHGSIILPTYEEASGVLSLTKDLLLKIENRNIS